MVLLVGDYPLMRLRAKCGDQGYWLQGRGGQVYGESYGGSYGGSYGESYGEIKLPLVRGARFLFLDSA